MIRLQPISIDLTVAEMESILYRNLYNNLLYSYESWFNCFKDNSWNQEEAYEILKRMQEADGMITVKDAEVQRNNNEYHYYNVRKKIFNYNRNKKNFNVQEKGIKTLTIVIYIDEKDIDFPIIYEFYRPHEKEPFYKLFVSWSEFQEINAISEF